MPCASVVRYRKIPNKDKEKHVSYLTPLVAAARDGQVGIIRLLVKQRAVPGQNPETRNPQTL